MQMNFPTSDLQFLALMIRKVRAQDQITIKEEARLDAIVANGYSSPADLEAFAAQGGSPAPVAVETEIDRYPGATRVPRR